MRILILGGDGMLGHQLLLGLSSTHEVTATLRQSPSHYLAFRSLFDPWRCLFGIDVLDIDRLAWAIDETQAEVVVNAVGIVKQRDDSKDAILSLRTNALLPHLLAEACAERGIRLIHFSTDCVYDGLKGMYRDSDSPDAIDLYGRTKSLGEIGAPGALTLRTSIIGLELKRKNSLVEWFLAQPGPIRGYRNAIYTGFTTLEMTRIVDHVLRKHPGKSGVYQVSSAPISKYDLLRRMKTALGLDIEIIEDNEFRCDRSLDSSNFRREFGYEPPSWDAMIEELCEQIRQRNL